MKVPQGVEKVVALATLSPAWRAKVLADPGAAAAEAGIELAEAELEILRAVSARMLAGMIDTFGKTVPRPAGLSKLAAGAAAALLVGSLLGCGDERQTLGERPDQPPPNPRKEEPPPPATDGIRPDVPPSREAPPKSPPPRSDPE